MDYSYSAIWACRSFICISRESIFAVLSAIKELRSSELGGFSRQKKCLSRDRGPNHCPNLIRKRGELIRLCAGIPLWRIRPAIRPNVEAMTVLGLLLNSKQMPIWRVEVPWVATHCISSGNLLNISFLKKSAGQTPQISFLRTYQCFRGSSDGLVTLERLEMLKSDGATLVESVFTRNLEIETMMLFNFDSSAKVKYFLISTNLTQVFIRSLQVRIN